MLEKELPLASVDAPQFAVYSSTYLTVRPKVSFQGVACCQATEKWDDLLRNNARLVGVKIPNDRKSAENC